METHCQRQASPRALQRLPTTEVFFDVLSLLIVRAVLPERQVFATHLTVTRPLTIFTQGFIVFKAIMTI